MVGMFEQVSVMPAASPSSPTYYFLKGSSLCKSWVPEASSAIAYHAYIIVIVWHGESAIALLYSISWGVHSCTRAPIVAFYS